jgi:hypothetical protein
MESETLRCRVCKDAGWLRYDVAVSHPNFGKIIECPYCTIVAERRAAKAAKAARNEH